MFSPKKKKKKETLNGQQPTESTDEKDDHTLEVSHTCSNINDQISVVLKLRPTPVDPKRSHDVMLHVPMRLICVVDASHSMDEPYGTLDDISKLDRIKMFAQLLIKGMNADDYLGIITFGTKAKVVLPLAKLSSDTIKSEAIETISQITVGGVTNMGAGLCTAIDQFKTHFRKSRFYNDNVILFTDGMANEGLTDTDTLTEEMNNHIDVVKDECQFDDDYTIKLATLGTGGFYPELLFNIGQIFGSDAFYFLDENTNLELNLMKPILFRQSANVSYISVEVAALNGVQFNRQAMSREYEKYDPESKLADDTKSIKYFIHDIPSDMEKNLILKLKLPNKHKKCLKNKDVLRVRFHYRDCDMAIHEIEWQVPYVDVPRKQKYNLERNVLISAHHVIRHVTQKYLARSCVYIHKLDRASAKNELEIGSNEITDFLEQTTSLVSESAMENLTEFSLTFKTTLEYCIEFIGDLSVRWDDAWARMKAIASSLSRELPTAAGVFKDDSPVYRADKVDDELAILCRYLAEIYKSLGLSTDVVEQYGNVILEFQERIRRAREEAERLIQEEQQTKSILSKHT